MAKGALSLPPTQEEPLSHHAGHDDDEQRFGSCSLLKAKQIKHLGLWINGQVCARVRVAFG